MYVTKSGGVGLVAAQSIQGIDAALRDQVSRIYDMLLTSHPLMSLYVSAAGALSANLDSFIGSACGRN